jgi:hypothetical protein
MSCLKLDNRHDLKGDFWEGKSTMSRTSPCTPPTPSSNCRSCGLMRTGRPLLLSASGRFPAGTYDRDGSLHVAWVEPGAGRLWTVRYARFPGGTMSQDTIRANTISIGVIRLEETSALDGMSLAADETHVYCVWSLIQTGAGTVRGTLGGLVFPLSDPGATRNLRLDPNSFAGITADVAAHLSLRWPIIVGGEVVLGAQLHGGRSRQFAAGDRRRGGRPGADQSRCR